jgi:hypothetical protein
MMGSLQGPCLVDATEGIHKKQRLNVVSMVSNDVSTGTDAYPPKVVSETARHDVHYYALQSFVPYRRPQWNNDTKSALDAMKSDLEAEYIAHLDDDEQIPYTRWEYATKVYRLTVQRDNEVVRINSHTRTDAIEAGRLAKAWADAGNSMDAKRSRKQKEICANAPKRKLDVAIHGDNTGLHRRCLVKLRDAIHARETSCVDNPLDRLHVHIMCDGTLANALYRTDRMPPGSWLSWKHKTTHGRSGGAGWRFKDVDGYTGMVIVCESEADCYLWAFDGASYHTWTRHLYVGYLRGKPKTTPTAIDGFCDMLRSYCTNAAASVAGAYPMTTLYDAERIVGKRKDTSGNPSNCEIERRCIVLFVDTVIGGEFSFAERDGYVYRGLLARVEACDDSLAGLIRAYPDCYRLTRDGHVFRYPEEQQSPTDLQIWTVGGIRSGTNAGVVVHKNGWQTYQFKSAQGSTTLSGMSVKLTTQVGTDDNRKIFEANRYKLGDNDYYVFVNAETRDMWCMGEDVMAAYKRIASPCVPVPLTGVRLHRGDSEASAYTCGWTKLYHFCV